MKKESRPVSKVYILDTSQLEHDANSFRGLMPGNLVVVPFPVLEELDNRKSASDSAGANARAVIRFLDELRAKGRLDRGVPTVDGGMLLVDNDPIPGHSLSLEKTDPFIIAIAWKWQNWRTCANSAQKNGARKALELVHQFQSRMNLGPVCIISKDFNLRVRANSLGLAAEDLRSDQAVGSINDLYSGFKDIFISESARAALGSLFVPVGSGEERRATIEKVCDAINMPELLPNEGLVFRTGPDGGESTRTTLGLYKEPADGEPYIRLISKPKKDRARGIRPRNNLQAIARAILIDPDIKLVTLAGIAGSGKTLMALSAGFEQLDRVYKEIVVYRSNYEIGQSLGFLKGGLKAKFGPWAQPIEDLAGIIAMGAEETQMPVQIGHAKEEVLKPILDIEAIVGQGKFSIQPLNYVRGRTLFLNFAIVDESQNFKPGDLKKAVTRIGPGSKMVLTGDVDPSQIDNPFLTGTDNGLAHVIERMKGQRLFGHLTLQSSERSEMAELAARLL